MDEPVHHASSVFFCCATRASKSAETQAPLRISGSRRYQAFHVSGQSALRTQWLGTVIVTVDTSHCATPQVRQDCAQQIADDLAAGILLALQNLGLKATFDYVHGVSGSITPGQIAYDLKGTIDVLGITVNDELTGSFGLTVDLSHDQLASINEAHNVNCSVDAGIWVTWIAQGAAAGAIVGGLAGLIGRAFGVVIGFIGGAVVGIVTAASTLASLVSTVSNDISAAIPHGIPILVQRVIANFQETRGQV